MSSACESGSAAGKRSRHIGQRSSDTDRRLNVIDRRFAIRTISRARLGALLVLLCSSLPARAQRPEPERLAQEASAALDAWRFEDATQKIDALQRLASDAPVTRFLDARLRFNRGDYDGASERLQRLLSSGGRAGRRARDLAELVDSTREATRGFIEARSPEGHFIIRYQPGKDELLLPYAFATLEAARRTIGGDFDALPLLAEPVRVEIYPEVDDLARVSTLTRKEIETSGTIALCKYDRLMITSPRALVHGYPWLDTLAHEFTHYVVTRVSGNTVPIWLHEGLAKYEERRWRADGKDVGLTPTMEHLLATALQPGRRLITFEEMSPSMAKLPSQADSALAFAEVYTVVEYLLAQRGWPGVRQAIAAMRAGADDTRAIAEVMGQGFVEFQRGWRAWLRGRRLRLHPGLVPASLQFAKLSDEREGKRDDDKDDEAAQGIGERRARRFVRLGGLLRVQGRMAAAAVEYEKAQAILGPGNYVVAERLGRTLLALDQYDRAIAVVEPALALYPERGGAAALLGEAWWHKREPAKAMPYLEAAIRVNPFDPTPHCALAELYAANDASLAQRERAACQKLSSAQK